MSSLHLEEKISIEGKFFNFRGQPYLIKGCSYGSFAPDQDGREYMDQKVLDQDFSLMRDRGFNLVRIPHTVPPRHLLDIAQRHGLHVMVSLSCEQYVGYLIDTHKKFDIFSLVKKNIESVRSHPALFAYALGNEIQPSQARWFGPRRIENFLKRLTRLVRQLDPGALVSYVNFPTTEYLRLDFLDFISFNVYIDERERYVSYLSRLQNIASDRPLLLAEVGVDSLAVGEERQAQTLAWLVEESFAAGSAGVCIFSWTDEWFVRRPLTEWAFGLTNTSRHPKPALAAVATQFQSVPFAVDRDWPLITVAICTFNGAKTLRTALEALAVLRYPNYETIVINDGSTDESSAIAAEYAVQLVSTENRGLSAARNTAWQLARGTIVAYLDDDAFPHPNWLFYIADTFMRFDCAAVGGPNYSPLGQSLTADAIAHAPGGPKAVLVTDSLAEHIPGCNMCIRRSVLEELGGFDARFRTAGDDVDICWRILERGLGIRYHAGAFVWHYARFTGKAFWKQQTGYGKAEALLQAKWPEKYNSFGHLSWQGRIYGKGLMTPALLRSRIYHGVFGTAPFQLRDHASPGLVACLLMMPEWYGLIFLSMLLTFGGWFWQPLLLFSLVLSISILAPAAVIMRNVKKMNFLRSPFYARDSLALELQTAFFYVLQALARLYGRIRFRLRPWWRKSSSFFWPWPQHYFIWSENWQESGQRIQLVESSIQRRGFLDCRGGVFDRWDLQVRGGLFGKARIFLAMENHGAHQMIRIKIFPRMSALTKLGMLLCSFFTIVAYFMDAKAAGLVLLSCIFIVSLLSLVDCAIAMGVSRLSLKESLR